MGTIKKFIAFNLSVWVFAEDVKGVLYGLDSCY